MKILKFSTKDFEFNLQNESEPIIIKHIAFAGINSQSEDFAAICFECIDNDNFIINLSIPINVTDDKMFFNNYTDIPLVGLLHTMTGVSNLSVVDLFRKTKYMGKEYYSTICWDIFSGSILKEISAEYGVYYKILLSRDQFIYIQAHLQSVLSGEYLDYFTHDYLLALTPKSNNISIDDSKNLNFKIIGVTYPKKSGLLFKKDYFEVDVLMLVNDKFCVLWSLSYSSDQIKEILKKKKYKEINIDDVYDYQIYKSLKYLIVDYAVNADNPIQKIVIFSQNIGTAVDEDDIYTTIIIHKQLYINWIEKIYKDLIT